MKHSIKIALLLSVLCLGLSSYLSKSNTDAPVALKDINAFHFEQMNRWNEKAEAFCALSNSETVSLEKIQQDLLSLREQFKRVEWSLAYLDPEAHKLYLNGAPLPKLDQNVNLGSQRILNPEGLQALEDWAFNVKTLDSSERKTFLRISQRFKSTAIPAAKVFGKHTFTDRQVIEALRFDLIRLASMGITGFDTPASGRAMNECKVVVETHGALIKAYSKDPRVPATMRDSLLLLNERATKLFTKVPDFNTFDRATFIKNYVNPLFSKLLDLQYALNAEFYYESSKTPRPFNFKSRNIFDADFISADFYTNVPVRYNKALLKKIGELLFFDPALSRNNERACASCHLPQKAFADGVAKSVAMDFKGTVNRNSIGLVNSVYSDRFFWDLRSNFLEDQMDHVIASEQEFHTSYIDIMQKLSKSSAYLSMFKEAFPEQREGNEINKYTLTQAFSTYIASLTALNSPFDKYMRGETSSLDPNVIKGFNLFSGKAGCATCHFAPQFSGLVPPYFNESESEILGVTATADFKHPVLDTDMGRSRAQIREQFPLYDRSFKTVTVRNAEYTAPYMHNGSLSTLEEVVSFYNLGGGAGMGLDVPYQTLPPDALSLSKVEQQQLVAFMKALSDTAGLNKKPMLLPKIEGMPELDNRVIGGKY